MTTAEKLQDALAVLLAVYLVLLQTNLALALASLGIIELKRTKKKGQKRESLQPEFNWDGFDIAV